MKKSHILNLGNPRKVKDNLIDVLDEAALEKIETEIRQNVLGLYNLGYQHYSFANKQSPAHWRQRVSRLYYAAYNISRSLRLFVKGIYSQDVKDHQKFNELPDDFPSKDRYVNQLEILREDRNMCDYDHTSRAGDLVLGTSIATSLVKDFLNTAKSYLIDKGVEL